MEPMGAAEAAPPARDPSLLRPAPGRGILTFLVVHGPEAGPAHRTAGTVAEAGGQALDPALCGGDPPPFAAAFYLAADAARAALDLVPPGGPRRAALCTGRAAAEGNGGPGALDRALALAGEAGPGEIVAAASAAVMAGPTLPATVVLTDRSAGRAASAAPAERSYLLRRVDPDGPGGPALVASALDWARRATRGPLIGRDREASTLDRAWAATRDGRPHLVIVSGEAGAGKTMLAADLAIRAHAAGALVLYGRWDPTGTASYQPVREALATYASVCPPAVLQDDLAGLGEDGGRLLSELTGRGRSVLARPREAFDEGRVFDAVAGWLVALTGRHATLLVLEDFQWADRPTIHMLDHVRQALADRPLMVVVTGRGDETELDDVREALAAGDAGPDGWATARVDVGGLAREDVCRLVSHAAGGDLPPAAVPLVAWLGDAAAGNPALVRAVAGGARTRADLVEGLRAAQHTAPAELVHVVRWRLNQLPVRAREVAIAAGALGATFELDDLAAATGAPPAMLRGPLDEVVRAGLLRAGPAPAGYRFTHALVVRALQDGDVATSQPPRGYSPPVPT